jgi:hypothetical protein
VRERARQPVAGGTGRAPVDHPTTSATRSSRSSMPKGLTRWPSTG